METQRNDDATLEKAPNERFSPGRLRINRFTARFFDKHVEQLYGNFSYGGRLRSLRLGSLIFSSFVLLYFIVEIIINGRIFVMTVEIIQLFGVAGILIYTTREYRRLRPPTLGGDEDTSREAWIRASAPTANRKLDAIAIYGCVWGWVTLITMRYVEDSWEKMPVAMVVFAWGVPLVSRAPFLPALLVHGLGIISFGILCSFQVSFTQWATQMSSLFSASLSGIFLSYTSSIYRRLQLRTILWYYGATPPGTSIFEFMKEESIRLRSYFKDSVKWFRFKIPEWEEKYTDFFHNRSILFVRLTILMVIISNGILYIPDVQLSKEDKTHAFYVRTYGAFPLWILCFLLSLPERLKYYRTWVITVCSLVGISLEFSVISQVPPSQVDPYFIMMWRIIDVTCTSFCLPFYQVSLVIGWTFLCSMYMLGDGNEYFFNLFNMILYLCSLAIGLYISSLSETDTRIAFLQFAHRLRSTGHDGFYNIMDSPLSRPSMVALGREADYILEQVNERYRSHELQASQLSETQDYVGDRKVSYCTSYAESAVVHIGDDVNSESPSGFAPLNPQHEGNDGKRTDFEPVPISFEDSSGLPNYGEVGNGCLVIDTDPNASSKTISSEAQLHSEATNENLD